MDKVAKVKTDIYDKAVAMSKDQDITIAEAISQLVAQGGAVPTGCELTQFRRVLETRGLTPPRRPDWVWGVTDVLPAEMLAGTKLEAYAEARREAELRCAVGDELYEKLVAGELTDEDKAEVQILAEVKGVPAPVTEEVSVTEEAIE